MRRALPALIAVTACLVPVAVMAHGRGGPGWDGPGWGGSWDGRAAPPLADRPLAAREAGPPEGAVTVSRFVAQGDAAKALRTGAITVAGAPDGSGLPSRELAVYEAAVVDQLAQAGYRTDGPAAVAGQVAELRVAHDTIVPAEQKKPVTGTMAVGVSNRGTAYGLGLNVDLTRPRGALVATRLEARIRDKASGAVLWEGRADVNTRDGDDNWPESRIAARLATALFDHFPGTSGETLPERP